MLPRLSKGKALDVAMGEGRNAVYLGLKGFKVSGFDISSTAVEHARQLAKDSGVELTAEVKDLDMHVFKLFEYDTVIVNFFKPSLSRYYSEIMRAMKQGATLLLESHTTEEIRNNLSPENPDADHFYRSNEVFQNFKGLQVLYYNESEIGGHHYVQFLGRKPLEKDAAKYGFAITTDKNEGPGASAQQKLAESLFQKKK